MRSNPSLRGYLRSGVSCFIPECFQYPNSNVKAGRHIIPFNSTCHFKAPICISVPLLQWCSPSHEIKAMGKHYLIKDHRQTFCLSLHQAFYLKHYQVGFETLKQRHHYILCHVIFLRAFIKQAKSTHASNDLPYRPTQDSAPVQGNRDGNPTKPKWTSSLFAYRQISVSDECGLGL